MADIKTRDVTRGSIKTLDRAASSMHHLKEETIRSKAADIHSRNDGDNAGSYAEEHIEQYAGDSTAYAARSGVEMLLRSRDHSAGGVIETEGVAVFDVMRYISGIFTVITVLEDIVMSGRIMPYRITVAPDDSGFSLLIGLFSVVYFRCGKAHIVFKGILCIRFKL